MGRLPGIRQRTFLELAAARDCWTQARNCRFNKEGLAGYATRRRLVAQADRQHTSSAASEDLRKINPDTLACQLSTQRTNAKTMAKRWRTVRPISSVLAREKVEFYDGAAQVRSLRPRVSGGGFFRRPGGLRIYGMLPLFGMVCVWRRRPLWHENDMTGVTQFIDPHRDTWTGGPQCILSSVSKELRSEHHAIG